MLEIRSNCENCDKALPVNSTEARICAFECTFCVECANEILHNVCPNCGGGFEKRPILPKRHIEKYPPKLTRIFKPVDLNKFQTLLEKNKGVKPENR